MLQAVGADLRVCPCTNAQKGIYDAHGNSSLGRTHRYQPRLSKNSHLSQFFIPPFLAENFCNKMIFVGAAPLCAPQKRQRIEKNDSQAES